MSAGRLEALTLLDAIDGYLAVWPSWTALRLARALIHEHHVETLEAWPNVERQLRAVGYLTTSDLVAYHGVDFAQRPAGRPDSTRRGLMSAHKIERP